LLEHFVQKYLQQSTFSSSPNDEADNDSARAGIDDLVAFETLDKVAAIFAFASSVISFSYAISMDHQNAEYCLAKLASSVWE
jgi:hypothetical protein